jgi:hypothetical protein
LLDILTRRSPAYAAAAILTFLSTLLKVVLADWIKKQGAA